MSIRSFAICFLLIFLSQPSLAQTKPPKPDKSAPAAPKPDKPAPDKPVLDKAAPAAASPATGPDSEVTTTTFGDWALRCQRTAEMARPACEVSLTIQEKNQPGPVAKIAIGRPVPAENVHVLVLLPNNISFPSSVQVRGDDKDIWSIDIPWQRCVPGACLAETKLKDSDLIRWKTFDNAGKLTFKDAQNNEIGITFSFHGLGQALDALAQQSQ